MLNMASCKFQQVFQYHTLFCHCDITPQAYTEHFHRLFSIPTPTAPLVVDLPNPHALPISPANILDKLLHIFKPSRANGVSAHPIQLVGYLCQASFLTLSDFFEHIATTFIPHAWNTISITRVYKKKGGSCLPINYWTVFAISPLPKLFQAYFDQYLICTVRIQGCHARFCACYQFENLVLCLDFAIDQVMAYKKGFLLAFLDIKKAFDRVPHELLFRVLLEQYGVN